MYWREILHIQRLECCQRRLFRRLLLLIWYSICYPSRLELRRNVLTWSYLLCCIFWNDLMHSWSILFWLCSISRYGPMSTRLLLLGRSNCQCSIRSFKLKRRDLSLGKILPGRYFYPWKLSNRCLFEGNWSKGRIRVCRMSSRLFLWNWRADRIWE